MKYLMVLCTFLAISWYSLGQSFTDAVLLLPYAKPLSSGRIQINVNKFNNDTLKAILSKYVASGEPISSQFNDIDENPFIRIKTLGGLDVTNFADGLARFMVKRAKEELSIAFFDQFNKELERQKDLQKLFPSTYSILKTASTEIYNYQKFLPALREAFEYDLDEFLTNAYDWSISGSEDLKLLNELKKEVKLHNSIKLIFYTSRELDHGSHPGDILTGVLEQPGIDLNALDVNLRSYIRVADLFSQSLRADADDRYWISKKELEQFRNPTFLKLYLGLLFQQCPTDLEFTVRGNKVSFRKILGETMATLNEVQGFVNQFGSLAAQIEDVISKRSVRAYEIKGSDYVSISKDMTTMVMKVLNTKIIATDKVNNQALEYVKFYADHAALLFANIESRAYNAAVFEAYAILDSALAKYSDRGKILHPFLKYGSFVASVATAETSAEVSEAIEAVALPAGSARIKREVAWNVSLNGYMGFFYGTENIPLADGTANKASSMGVFAPVGIAFSRGFNIRKANFSATLFGSLIDIGALAAFRLDDDDLETVPKIELENIVSPGAYFILGLPKVPISVGYGYQIGPGLREVKEGSTTVVEDKYNRWAAFIAVDIPLINFYSKPKK